MVIKGKLGLVFDRVGGSGNGEGEKVNKESKDRGEIRGEAGEVTGVVVNRPTMDSLGKRYGEFSEWG